MMLSLSTLAAAALLLAYQPAAPQPMPDWKPLQFLIGSWAAQPDPDSGGTTFERDLQGRILIRRNFSLTAGSRHEDLMIIRYDGSAKAYRADYIDNEGHMIHYRVITNVEGKITFLSSAPDQPRYRLTYQAISSGAVDGTFEIAPPDHPDSFRLYLSWTMKKAAAKP